MDEAQFADLGSAPATTEAARLCILKGLLPGNRIEQADARQAYIQAKLGGTETWVEIPVEGWPPEWKVDGPPCKRPCARLIQALYGHPDSGTYWEMHMLDYWVWVLNQQPKLGHHATYTKLVRYFWYYMWMIF